VVWRFPKSFNSILGVAGSASGSPIPIPSPSFRNRKGYRYINARMSGLGNASHGRLKGYSIPPVERHAPEFSSMSTCIGCIGAACDLAGLIVASIRMMTIVPIPIEPVQDYMGQFRPSTWRWPYRVGFRQKSSSQAPQASLTTSTFCGFSKWGSRPLYKCAQPLQRQDPNRHS
jgi:hypothetical protein